ncbi:MAG: tetratricopeptide repeat protein [Bacteroidia bacterium]
MKAVTPVFQPRHQLLFLLFLAFVLNANTLYNEYALDDAMVITRNQFVEKGFKGIPAILSTDLMRGFTVQKSLSVQVRYRPLPLVILAVENQFFGNSPFAGHLTNVMLFMVLVALLYRLLATLVRDTSSYLPFLACLLFVVHPVHTEVIANIKSMDELLAFILLLLSLVFLPGIVTQKQSWKLALSLICYLMALLCRESAVTFIGVLPLILFFFYNKSLWNSLKATLPFAGIFVLYLLIRYAVVGMDYYNVKSITLAPFMLATPAQAFATKIFILIRYIGLLFFPFYLSSDYGYNQIPYVDLVSPEFVVSALLLCVLILFSLYQLRKRSMVAFSILYFFITISIGSNLILELGSPMADRMLFQPSLAFCILLALFSIRIAQQYKVLVLSGISVICIVFSVKTVLRNREWTNTETLYLADVQTAPNSARISLGASEVYRSKGEEEQEAKRKQYYFEQARICGERSLQTDPGNPSTYISLGFLAFDQYNYTKAAEYYQKGYALDTNSEQARECLYVLSTLFYKHGNSLMEEGKTQEAEESYRKAMELSKK